MKSAAALAVDHAAALARPRASGVAGEATTFYFDRDFGRHAVKVLPGEFFVAGDDIVLSTLLGSCVSACLWDRHARLGGMNHFLLPAGGESAGDSGRYGVFAMELVLNEMLKRGGRKSNFEAKVFGGGAVMRQITTMNVGQRNASFVLGFLKMEGIPVVAQDLLEAYPRRVAFLPQTGKAMLKKLASADASLVAAEQSYSERLAQKPVAGDVELF